MPRAEDIDAGFEVWNKIALCQELQVSPFLYQFYERVIVLLWNRDQVDEFGDPVPEDKKIGINRKDILEMYARVYGTSLGMLKLRHDYLPLLESAGIIYQEPDQNDRHQMLVYPALATKKPENKPVEYSANDSGVKSSEKAENAPTPSV